MPGSNKRFVVSNDAEVIGKILEGDSGAFEILMRRCNPILYKVARGFGFNHQDAEDLMQETHIAAYKNLGQFSFDASYKTWISKIMYRKCLYRTNLAQSKNETPNDFMEEDSQPLFDASETSGPEDSILRKEFSNILESALQKIPVKYRMVFLLREIEGMNVSETADLLAITPINVKVRLNRAKAMLQKKLEAYYNSANPYDFNLVYCDRIINNVFAQIQNNL
jgi:RNA polymerase sigma factor (sigma-70 family)